MKPCHVSVSLSVLVSKRYERYPKGNITHVITVYIRADMAGRRYPNRRARPSLVTNMNNSSPSSLLVVQFAGLK